MFLFIIVFLSRLHYSMISIYVDINLSLMTYVCLINCVCFLDLFVLQLFIILFMHACICCITIACVNMSIDISSCYRRSWVFRQVGGTFWPFELHPLGHTCGSSISSIKPHGFSVCLCFCRNNKLTYHCNTHVIVACLAGCNWCLRAAPPHNI